MRCRGTTKAGARCKRNAPEGSEYCATHVGQAAKYADATVDSLLGDENDPKSQAGSPTEPGRAPGTESATDEVSNNEVPNHDESNNDWWDKAVEVATVGAVIVAALALGRAIRAL